MISNKVRNGRKQRQKYPEILLEPISGQNITTSPQVICAKDKPHIRACPFHSLLCENITEPPLSFNSSVWMFNNSLTAFIKVLLVLIVISILFVILCKCGS